MDADTLVRFLTLADANTRYVVTGSLLLGIAGGLLGTFALLRRQSLIGDALAHAALPGVCVAFMVTQTKDPLLFLAGALVAGLLAVGAIGGIQGYSRIKDDAAIGIVLSVFFGVGIVLLTMVQRSASGNQSGLDKFLFGQAASLVGRDVQVIGTIAVVLCAAVALLYKELKLHCFDPGFAASLGYPRGLVEGVLMVMIAGAVVAGIQAVGVVLMAAMLITPAAAARLWTDRLSRMLVISGAIGAVSGYVGSLLSALAPRLPTGPLMVLVATAFFAGSVLFAPGKGLVARNLRLRRERRRIHLENTLKDMLSIFERSGGERIVRVAELAKLRHESISEVTGELETLRERGLTESVVGGWTLNPAGEAEARRILRGHRIWELYLTEKLQVSPEHVHREAEDLEHFLSRDMVDSLDRSLGRPEKDPHGKAIPRE